MRRVTWNVRPFLFAAMATACSAVGLSCGGDDSQTEQTDGAAGSSDASTDRKDSAVGVAGSGGSSGSAGSGGTAGTGGADGGPRDGTSGGAGGTAGKGGTGGGAGTGGAAGSGGSAGSGGNGGTDGGPTDAARDGADGSAGAAGAAGSGGTGGAGGGDAASPDVTPDASGDATDASAGDAAGDGGDGGALCTVDETACSNSGTNGLCKSQVCAACIDGPGPSGDDAHCGAAYGGAFLCSSGVCAPGDCRLNSDCNANANGPLCGIAQANFCDKCTTDAQCLAANSGTPVCNTASGLCIVSAASCNGQADNMQCTVNSADVCCGSACTPGNCCPGAAGDTLCKTRLGNNAAVCSAGHQCTTCDAVAGLTYLVDPLNGNDSGATGSGTSSGGANAACAFKTVTRALQAIGLSPAPGTVVQIKNTGPVSQAGNGETFPINITTNVTITASGGLVTVTPSAGQVAFGLASAASGINGTLGGGSMTIDGATNTAFNGVLVTAGSTDATSLQKVTIQNFLREGVRVQNGTLTMKQGVTVTGSGTTAARRPGLHVTGSSHVNIAVPGGQATTAFNNNTQHGILVDGTSSVTITGVQSGGSGTIECRGNNIAGLAIAQTPGASLPLNLVNGFLAVGTTGGNGIRIEGGSNVKLRNSYSLGNSGNGIIVATSVIGATRNNALTDIDLGRVGDAADPGGNTFQATIGSNANTGAGICLAMDQNSGTLMAQGNMFSGGKNCGTTAASLTFNNGNCGGNRDLGLQPRAGGNATGNDIDVTLCTHP